ncbi:MAG: hypothetical protein PHV95_08600, partial [Eubacteriales bacterium]|nr:hypothetical protein [Eubacteriales bacterium]
KLVLDSIVEFEKSSPGKLITISKVSQIASTKPNVSEGELQSAIKGLLENGYLTQREVAMRNRRSETVLFVDWNKLSRESVYNKN